MKGWGTDEKKLIRIIARASGGNGRTEAFNKPSRGLDPLDPLECWVHSKTF